jgi:hypothetical protein
MTFLLTNTRELLCFTLLVDNLEACRFYPPCLSFANVNLHTGKNIDRRALRCLAIGFITMNGLLLLQWSSIILTDIIIVPR